MGDWDFEDDGEPYLAACSVGSIGLEGILSPAMQLRPRPDAYPLHMAAAGGGCAASLASLRRFWAIAASVNSSCAALGPRSLRRSSFRMRFRWANSISTRLRSWRDCSNASVLASARATSRASSYMLRGILRAGSFGQHRILNAQTSQSSLLAL